jgi:hypothetical protein
MPAITRGRAEVLKGVPIWRRRGESEIRNPKARIRTADFGFLSDFGFRSADCALLAVEASK